LKKKNLAGLLLSIQIIIGILFSWIFYSCNNIYPMLSIESLFLRTKFVIPEIDMEKLSDTSDIYSSMPITSSFAFRVFKTQKLFLDNVFKMKRMFYVKREKINDLRTVIFFYNNRIKSIISNLKGLMNRINHSGSKKKIIKEFDMFQNEWSYLLDSSILYRKVIFCVYSIFQIILSFVVLILFYDFAENNRKHFYILIFLLIIFMGTTDSIFMRLDYYQLSRDILKNHKLIHDKVETVDYDRIRNIGDIYRFFQGSKGDGFDFYYTLASISESYIVRYHKGGKQRFLFLNKNMRNIISIITDKFNSLLPLNRKEDALKAMREISGSVRIFLVSISSFHKEVFLMIQSLQLVLILFFVLWIFICIKK